MKITNYLWMFALVNIIVAWSNSNYYAMILAALLTFSLFWIYDLTKDESENTSNKE